MRRTNLKTSVVLLAIAIFFAGLANQVQAHPPCGAGYHGGFGYGATNRCGPYGCNTLGMPAWQPGSQVPLTPGTTTITIERK